MSKPTIVAFDIGGTWIRAYLLRGSQVVQTVRLRAVVKGPDGYVYISTSNTDGRGDSQTVTIRLFGYLLNY